MDYQRVKFFVFFAMIFAIVAGLLKVLWESRYNWMEPFGGSLWKLSVGYLAGNATDLIHWLDTHEGTTAAIIGCIGIAIQGWSALMRYKAAKRENENS